MSIWETLKKKRSFSFSVFVFTLCAGVLLAAAFTTGVKAAREQAVAPDATPLVVPAVKQLPTEFTKLAKMLDPSVVYISTDYTPKQVQSSNRNRQGPADEDDDGSDMFRRFFGQSPFGGPAPRQFRQQGAGSGFIVDKNGYIITNQHVVDNADSIKVKLTGEQHEYKAKLIGSDVETDVAVIKIDVGRPLPTVKIANSDGVQVGDWAIAIGAPFGLETSVTAGIVSATGRDIGAQQFQRFIQTDAAINPGNSGGPLVNINGEVIGMNTMIATRSGGYQGIGFALPINTAAKVYNSIIKTGRMSRGSIGIQFSNNIKPEVLKALGVDHGVVVGVVRPDGPAARSGLRQNDILLALNGSPVKDGDDLVNRISNMAIGSEVKITLDRDGQRLDKVVTIEDREKVFKDDPRFARNRPEMTDQPDSTTQTAKFGIGIRPLTSEQRESLNFTEPGGVMVTMVEENSFAEEIGLQEKDIIVSINRKPVASFDDVKKIQSTLKPGDAVAFQVMRPTGQGRRGKYEWGSVYLGGTIPND
ncbi:MAG: Do family serine endopeptidase [Bryobacterales bacterium]|nr:Do family serine endopeptidase [Bryobacterales bacterium]